MNYIILCRVIFILLLFSQSLYAQISHIKNPMFVGARPMSMGETFVAIANDANAIYWNPAGLPLLERYEFQFMHANLYNTGIKNNYAAILLPDIPFLTSYDNIAFGFDWRSISFGDDELEHTHNDFSLSVAYRPIKSLSLGGKIKYLRNNTSLDKMIEGKATGWGMDFGILFSPFQNIKLGMMIYDATDTKVKYNNNVKETLYYRNMRYGLSYKLKDILFLKNPIIAMDIDDRIHFGAELWLQNIIALRGGLYKDIYENGEKEITFSFGAGIRYKFIQFDYALTNSPFLENTNRFSLNFNFNLPPSPIKIESIEVRDIYASQFIHHEEDTCAVVDLVYDGQKPIECKVSYKEKKYGIEAEEKVKFDPKIEKTKQVILRPSLPNKLLNLPQGDSKLTQATIIIEPKTIITTKIEKQLTPDFSVYGPGTIDWAQGTELAAAFVCPQDKLVDEFTSAVQQIYNKTQKAFIANRNITLASLLFNAISEYGIRYKVDSNTPFAQYEKYIDTIQYPYQLLQKKHGDCDDTTILYASLLENMGIRTAFVDVPRHILLIFDTDIHERYFLKLCLPEYYYIFFDNHVWLPIETTMYGKSFWEALEKGTEQYQTYQAEGKLELIDVHEAWQQYRPVYISYKPDPLEIPSLQNVYFNYKQDLRHYIKTRDRFLNENYYEPLQKNPHDSRRQNQLAYILYHLGKEDQALERFEKLIGK